MTESMGSLASSPSLSIIIPTLNEVDIIERTLQCLAPLRQQGCELLVADGGSHDNTLTRIENLIDHGLIATKGRSLQMNAGAKLATGQWLLFLHADTQLPKDISCFLDFLQTTQSRWGFFCLRLSGPHFSFRIIEAAINIRSRLSSVATGDQCLFVRRDMFESLGGYPQIPLMEDVAMSKVLRKKSKPFCWRSPVMTSSRRWEQAGIAKTVLLMWRLRLAYFFGVSPQRLAKLYYG
jgi:rSAM/selenodomain-associated transferase 2